MGHRPFVMLLAVPNSNRGLIGNAGPLKIAYCPDAAVLPVPLEATGFPPV